MVRHGVNEPDVGRGPTSSPSAAGVKPTAQSMLQKWRELLTDFTARNPLLFFNPAKGGALMLTNDPSEIYARVVSGARIPVRELLPAPPPPSARVSAPLDIEELCTKLRRKAKTYVEETGLNPLTVAIGLCTWQDLTAQIGATRWCRAPVVLLPVTLERRGMRGDSCLVYDQSAPPVINPVLRRALIRQFALHLPDDPDDDIPSLPALNACLDPLRADARFTFSPALVLGLFSFSRLVMVDDLEHNEARILDHPLLGPLVKSRARGSASTTLMPEESLDAHYARHRSHCVLDADSSQQVAIEAVKAGHSLIVQGPPGTGKSQTITNMIAELLAAGKKVLFVSEKRAALDVVLRRMDVAGLRGLCLAVHDNTDKKAVINDLYQTCEKARTYRPAGRIDREHNGRLKQCRGRLNEHARLLHERDPVSGLTLYEAYGALCAWRETPHVDPHAHDPMLFDRERIDQVAETIERLVGFQDLLAETTQSPWHATTLTRALSNQERMSILKHLDTIETGIAALEQVALEIGRLTGAAVTMSRLSTINQALDLAAVALNEPGLDALLLAGGAADREARVSTYHRMCAAVTLYRTQRAELLSRFSEGLFALPLEEIQARLDGPYSSRLARWVSHSYRRDRAAMEALQQVGTSPGKLSYEQFQTAITTARGLVQQKADLAGDTEAARLLGAHYHGADTDIDLLAQALGQNARYAALFEGFQGETTPSPISDRALAALEQQRGKGLATVVLVEASIRAVANLFPPLALHDWDDDAHLLQVREDSMVLAAQIQQLVRWLDYCELQQALMRDGFPKLLSILRVSGLPVDEWSMAFRHGMCRAWVADQHSKHPSIDAFQQTKHEDLIKEFVALDWQSFDQAKLAILAKHAEGVRSFLQADLSRGRNSQHHTLAHEAHKTRQILPVRRLMEKIPELLLHVKPCWLMSPLSVTQMVEAARTQFDVVIFDEASQIKMEEGVCAVLRARQAVVVGDNRQLPPTSFFEQAFAADESEADDGAEGADESAFESILDRCAAFLPSCRLRWHYRSKDESLIAFSNDTYYDGDLITFPNAERRQDMGVRLHHVADGIYDRGGTRTNMREAEVVAGMILEHYAAHRLESLGVIALSQPQQDAIRNALDALLRHHVDVAVPEEGSDALFIKNLENVQGDERDAIILSIGYARDPKGVLSHNFGPLNKDGGGRRLNVAITRARKSLTVVSSIRASDLNLSRTGARAVEQLRDYLAFAEVSGQHAVIPAVSGGTVASQLEQDIVRRLEERGVSVETRVGYSDQRIDLAIVDPQQPDRYLIGIECDGLTYYAAPTARDRDRLRRTVLEGLGWKIHSMWAREWLRDPEAEVIRLLNRLPRPIDVPPPSVPARRLPAPTVPLSDLYARTLARQGSLNTWAAMPRGRLFVGATLFDHYRIDRILGHGAFGQVYHAEDLNDPMALPLAIKELRNDQTSVAKQDMILWFRREIGTLLQLNHPKIPKVRNFWVGTESDGPFYLVMDYIDGKTLEQVLRDKELIGWEQVARWGMSLCEVLAYLHTQTPPFVFRDLKPSNIMIDGYSNELKLIDFGLTRRFATREEHIGLGTWGYMPDEQNSGNPEPRSDIHALGATLHELISGRSPYREFIKMRAKGLSDKQALKEIFPPLKQLVPGLPPRFVEIVVQATAFQAQHRFRNAIEFGLALGQALDLSESEAREALRNAM